MTLSWHLVIPITFWPLVSPHCKGIEFSIEGSNLNDHLGTWASPRIRFFNEKCEVNLFSSVHRISWRDALRIEQMVGQQEDLT
ncbi:hypothetical protein OUZ56_020137 [Daphnia magna]|uniref:Uncharacterized protein n=1 Tax=Daphnia magna TaxID=35525 RepID=A0ABQ9ZDN1_9CRUS|nr:hypothetical protein OUZ56_020137 [Daphnia magna]